MSAVMKNLIGEKLADDTYVGDLVLYDDSFYVIAHLNTRNALGTRKIILFENGHLDFWKSNSIKYPPPEKLSVIDELLQRVRAGFETFKGQSITSSEYAKFLQHNIDLEFPE